MNLLQSNELYWFYSNNCKGYLKQVGITDNAYNLCVDD